MSAKAVLAAFAAAALLAGPALAGAPSDTVRFFYSPPTYEPDPSVRGRFVDPARAKFEANDKLSDGEDTCFDWVLGIDAQDFDQGELDKTLKLDEKVAGDTAVVTATFLLFAEGEDSKREIEWDLKKVGDDWKVADIASKTGDWRLSALKCE